jgi:hypothetical protein
VNCGYVPREGVTRNPYTVLGLRIGLKKVPFQMAVSGVAVTKVASHL